MIDLLFADDILVYSIPALFGTFFFVLRIGISLVTGGLIDAEGSLDDGLDAIEDPGAAGDVDAAADHDVGAVDAQDAAHANSNTVFKFLSIQTITAFAMGFGWVGLAARRTFNLGATESVVVGVLGGVAFVWFLLWLLRVVYSLQSSGNLGARDAVGMLGEVYVEVPANNAGAGQVRVTIRDRQRLLRARTAGDAIPRRTAVRVVRVNGDNTVLVTSNDA